MKHLMAAGALSLALAGLASGQPADTFENNQVINFPPDPPPVGYATNYINKNSISVSVGLPFYFYEVQNYTNTDQAILSADIGFLFNYTPAGDGITRSATSFYNAGTIDAGLGTVPALGTPAVAPPPPYPITQIWATNIVNRGLINVSVAGNLFITGSAVDLSRSTLNIQGFDYSVSPSSGPPFGMFDNYWGGGNQANTLGLANVTWPNVRSTSSAGSNISGSYSPPALSLSSPTPYIRTNVVASSNQVYQFIYIKNSGPAHAQMDADFVPITTGTSDLYNNEVRWIVTTTNYYGKVLTDTFYLLDTLPNASNVTIGSNQITQGGQFLYAPSTYTMSRTASSGFSPWPISTFDSAAINASNAFPTNNPRLVLSNAYAIWGLNLLPVTYQPDPLDPSQTYTNIPGRVEITTSNLSLSRTILEGPNYVNLTASNFTGSPNAQMEFPVSDFTLGNPAGTLVISNLVVPYLSRPTGYIHLWSTAWANIWTSNDVSTNVQNGTNVLSTNDVTITNRYSILMVDSTLSNTSGCYQEHVTLDATNVLLSDSFTIASNLYTTARNFTLTQNATLPLPSELDFLSTAILWSPSFPNLQNFTNWGIVSVGNTTFFSHRASPLHTSPGDSPYASYVNHGTNTSVGGNLFWSTYFENSGVGAALAQIRSFSGDLAVQANTALLANDHMTATNGDMYFNVGSLTVSNTYLQSDGELYLTVTNQITDGGVLGSIWLFGYGMDVSGNPRNGDLLDTSITLTSPANTEVDVIWPGADLGAVPNGFVNNVAVGQLALFTASTSSAFHFGAASGVFGTNCAIYIDKIVLQGGLAHATLNQLAAAFDVDPNMKIYFGHAYEGAIDYSSVLAAANGAFAQVPGFSGPFIASKPGISAFSIPLTITSSGPPANTPIVSWQAVPSAYNILYSAPDPVNGPWTEVTSILVGPDSYPVSLPITNQPSAASYYKLGVQPLVP